MEVKYMPMPPIKTLFSQNQGCPEPDTPLDALLLAGGRYLSHF